jgi:hypothetical protein
MRTVSLPLFKEFRDVFYDDSLEGKLIPVEYLMRWWGDEILAVWYFDDGCIDDRCGDITISNKCPRKDQLDELVTNLRSIYGWDVNSGTQGDMYRLYFPKNSRKAFGDFTFLDTLLLIFSINSRKNPYQKDCRYLSIVPHIIPKFIGSLILVP